MSTRGKTLFLTLLLSAVVLAGCSDSGGSAADEKKVEQLAGNAPKVEATATTGGIRGLIVDEAIRPIKGANIEVAAAGDIKTAVTGDSGTFTMSGLEPGQYFVKASHPLYTSGQQTVEVVAGQKDPPVLKIQLLRQVFQEPYAETLKYDGFIVCSANVPVGYSEECGEGLGLPGTLPPPLGGMRVGKQGNNRVQFDYMIHDGLQTSILEVVWKATSDAGKSFLVIVSADWLCDPFCGGQRIVNLEGASPLYGKFDAAAAEKAQVEPEKDYVTMFTYASRATSPTPSPAATGLLLNQAYQDFVTNFYYVPAPEGWSFVKGDSLPGK